MSNNYLERYKSSHNSKIRLFSSGLINYVTVRYLNKLFDLGEIKSLEFEDLFAPEDHVMHLGNEDFVHEAKRAIMFKGAGFDYFRFLLLYISKEAFPGIGVLAASQLCNIPVPFLLKKFLEWVGDDSKLYNFQHGLWLAFLVCICSTMKIFLTQLCRKYLAGARAQIATINKVRLQ